MILIDGKPSGLVSLTRWQRFCNNLQGSMIERVEIITNLFLPVTKQKEWAVL